MLLTIIGSIIIGAVLMLLVQMWLAQKWFFALPQLEPPTKNQYDNFKLPEALHIEGSTEDERRNPERLLCLNLIFQFLFQETKDTKQFRK
ncbi:hypothetical protein NP493_2355g00009 [Ridgeia piscesae]|uniref:Uncharacterized protein n=1 Tax=Ridgeia piscesae TaxID=27915 RepID=A0AAD9JHY6_RIDPI|nr:hypothetical protein NP493_2355g00009 [Ridgeia piscesae]